MVVTCGARENGVLAVSGPTSQNSRSDRSGSAAVRSQRAALNPEAQGLWARVLVRAVVVAAAGVMALGFLGVEAALLICFLCVLTYVLLWLRSRYGSVLFTGSERPSPRPGPETEPGDGDDPDDTGGPPNPRRPPDDA